MKLSLPEAATALGRSERQVRYLIKTGRLEARKDGGRWTIDSADLPLTDAQRGAIAGKVEVARAAFEKGLAPAEKAAAPEEKRRYSVTDLQAFQVGEPLYRELRDAFGADDSISRDLYDALELLTRGCHAFQPSEKAARFTEAREAAAKAAIQLILSDADPESAERRWAERIEQELIPRIANLIASQERRSRRDRFERFGGVLGGRARGR